MDEMERLERAVPQVPGLRPEARAACKEALFEMIEEEMDASGGVPPKATAIRKRRTGRTALVAAAAAVAAVVGVAGGVVVGSDEPASATLAYGVGNAADTGDAESLILQYEGTINQHDEDFDAQWCFQIAESSDGEVVMGTGGGGPTLWAAEDLERICDPSQAPPAETLLGYAEDTMQPGATSEWPGDFSTPVGIQFPDEAVSPGDTWQWEGFFPAGPQIGGDGEVRWQCSSTLVALDGDIAEIDSSCVLPAHDETMHVFDSSDIEGDEIPEGGITVTVDGDEPGMSQVDCTTEESIADETIRLDLGSGLVVQYDGVSQPGGMVCPEGALPGPEMAMPTVVTHAELVGTEPVTNTD